MNVVKLLRQTLEDLKAMLAGRDAQIAQPLFVKPKAR